jgi:hypothetical protein
MKEMIRELAETWRDVGRQIALEWRDWAAEWADILADAWRLVREAFTSPEAL